MVTITIMVFFVTMLAMVTIKTKLILITIVKNVSSEVLCKKSATSTNVVTFHRYHKTNATMY